MKRYLNVLLLVAIALTSSSCGVLSAVYDSQQNYLSPQHTLDENTDYQLVWNKLDIQVSTLISSSGKIIVEGFEKGNLSQTTIFGIDSMTGKILWKIAGSLGETIIASGDFFYRGTVGTTKVYTHKVENGEIIWSTLLPLAHSAWSLSSGNNNIYIHSNNGIFYVLNEQGEIIDHFSESSRIFSVSDNVLYVEENYSIKAIDYPSRKTLWQLDIRQRYVDPVFDGGEIFIRTWNPSADIYAIDQSTQKINWKTSQNIQSNFCIIKGKIYFTSPDGYLVTIDRNTGNEISRVKFSPQFDLEKQIGVYHLACDSTTNVLAITFGDNTQVMGLEVINP